MEHIDQSQHVDMYAPKSPSRMLRWFMWIMLIVAAVMMAVVLLSQPRAAPYVQSGLDRFDGMVITFRSDKTQPQPAAGLPVSALVKNVSAVETVSTTETATRKKPTVLSMPTSRIPVIRIK